MTKGAREELTLKNGYTEIKAPFLRIDATRWISETPATFGQYLVFMRAVRDNLVPSHGRDRLFDLAPRDCELARLIESRFNTKPPGPFPTRTEERKLPFLELLKGTHPDLAGRRLEGVSADDATAFAKWFGARLPETSEWKWAARALPALGLEKQPGYHAEFTTEARRFWATRWDGKTVVSEEINRTQNLPHEVRLIVTR